MLLFYLAMIVITFVILTVLGELEFPLSQFYRDALSAISFSIIWPLLYLLIVAMICNIIIVSLVRLIIKKYCPKPKSSLYSDEES